MNREQFYKRAFRGLAIAFVASAVGWFSSAPHAASAANPKSGVWTGALVDQDCVTNNLSQESQKSGKGARRMTGEGGSAYSDKTKMPSVPNGADAGAPADEMRNTPGERSATGAPAHLTRFSKVIEQCRPTTATQSFGIAQRDGTVLRLSDESNVKAKQLVTKAASQTKSFQVSITGSRKGDIIQAQSVNPARHSSSKSQ